MNHIVQKQSNTELDIIEKLLKKESHIREIAKKLKKPHSTISRKLEILKKENIIDFKIEGKNKIFFLKQNFITKNYILKTELNKLKKLLEKHPELNIVFEEVLKKTKEKLIILFGSYAKGTEKKHSDIDIYVETENKKIKKLIENINSKISVKIGHFNKDSDLIKEIIKNHVIIRGIEEFYEK